MAAIISLKTTCGHHYNLKKIIKVACNNFFCGIVKRKQCIFYDTFSICNSMHLYFIKAHKSKSETSLIQQNTKKIIASKAGVKIFNISAFQRFMLHF